MVEWKKIGDICYISDYVSNGSFASLRENVQYKSEPDYAILVRFADYSSGFDKNKFVYIDEHAYNFLSKSSLKGEEIVMSNVGSCGLYFRCPKLDRKMSLAPNSIMIRSEYNNYLFHWFGTQRGKEEIKKITSKSAMPKFNKTEFKKILIPLPSTLEQERIVGILDTFTSSIDNLKQQIAQRRKQYEYYRDQLYYPNKKSLLKAAEEGKVEIKTFDEIGTFTRGRRFVRTDIVQEGVPCIHYGDMYTYYGISAYTTPTHLTHEIAAKLRFANKGDVVIVAAGENDLDIGVGVAWLGDEDVVVHDACFIYKHNMNSKYISHYLRSNNYHQQIRMGVVDGKICSISAKELGRTLIAVPPLSEQQRIVDILDKFEASIQNLEAQLSQREKQYEYYRNKLLTFE